MDQYSCISVNQALELIEQGVAVADIRDPQNFQQGHMPGAVNLSNDNLHQFLTDADMDRPLIVCCYHGISSQPAAAYLVEQGFETVYSMDGGFELWQATYPDKCARD
ncbi:thiosulfate sulfurtransferase GlpE [Marinobacterium arenosum]|uniref:thiosulfate sulfurtransferase GlpE n=1 Tax=Marinobacterium arenosum TaxID=2862496 RepID=UPI001C98198C|nr:thiosulfate sulfurtransferase GlpE [Marinobacterium arenosum]MBY4676067.1 thiosulfate sulfurtransferase GlpE [Marinobacterium arenosum]